MIKKIYFRFIGLVAILLVIPTYPCLSLNFSLSQEIISEIEPNDNSLIEQISKNLNRRSFKTAFMIMKGANFEKLSKNEKEKIVKKIVHLSIHYQEINNPDSTLLFSHLADSINAKYNLANTNVNCELKYLKGWSLYKKSKVDQALIEFNKALSGCRSENDSLEVLILKYLGNIYFINRNFEKAYNYYHKSLNLELSRKNSSDAIIAGLYQNKGIIHASYKNYDSARIFFRESIQLKEKVMDENDPKLANGYLNFSLYLWEIGDLRDALVYINKAEEIFQINFGSDYLDLAPLYLNKGIILFTLQDVPEALQYFNLALELNKKINHPNISDYAIYSNIGAAYGEMNDFSNAIRFNKLALEFNPEPEVEVMILINIAVIYKAIFDLDKAAEYHLAAIKKAEKLDYYPSKAFAEANLSYANFLITTNDLIGSYFYIARALEAYKILYGEKNRKVCEVYTEMSKYYDSQDKYDEALKSAQKALIAGQKSFSDKTIFKNPEVSQLTNDFAVFSAFLQKGKLLNKYYDKVEKNIDYLKASLESARLGITILENIKSSLKGEDSKLLLTTSSNEIYDLAVEVNYKLYHQTEDISYLFESFKFSEKGKAAVLLSNVREMEALQVGNIPEDIRKIESGLKSELEQYQSILYEEKQKVNPDTNKIARIRMATYRSGLVYDSLTQILEKNFPDYYNLKYNFNAISIPDIQNKISENTVLVEYKVVDSILYTYLVSRNTSFLIRKDVGDEFYDKIQRFVSLINVMPEVTNVKLNSIAFANLGYEIYNELSLNHSILEGKQNVIIVPDNILGYLSFDALVCSQVDSSHTGYNKLDYLVEKFAVSYGYSATLYFSGKHHIDAKDNILAMAPLYERYKNEGIGLDMSSQREIFNQITPLKHTLKEVLDIGRIIPGELLTEGNATEANFKSLSDKYKILHFAMHAIIDDDDPLTSKLIFDIDNSDTIEDGFLNTYEIYNLDLNAELAVLSACKTGTGRLSRGEGIMSLARGFLYAGVPGIVMTLWAIEDVSSAQIITYFYEFLKDGSNKDIALRNAKLEYLKNANQLQSHPYFWAAYVQIGDNSALSSGNKVYLYYIGIAAFLLITIVIVFRNKQKRAKY